MNIIGTPFFCQKRLDQYTEFTRIAYELVFCYCETTILVVLNYCAVMAFSSY